jgi:DNA polymerase I-like protein with 3'-5' exonuclease and polymerase domains
LDVVPSELDVVKKQLRKIMCEDLREHWQWITVPLDIDAEISAVDGNWYEMKPEEI